jgi:hypothetical protein|nr:MAG TPA: hypothetical protein [Bacteriophage sp.]
MPKWTEYTSKDTLADNDEVMLYDATARANKRGLMSKFWDYVVDKMSTAVISKLETNNKTIIGAINALNSESKKKFNGNISSVVFRSGSSGIDNVYLDFYTTDGKRTTIGFYTDGMNGIQMMKDNALIWSIKA